MKRITVLIGAGAMKEATDVTTTSITNHVVEKCKECKFENNVPVLEQFCLDYKNAQSKLSNPNEANFEDLLDMLEILADYNETGYNTSSSVVLATLKDQYNLKDKGVLFHTRHTFINAINDYIYDYDKDFLIKGTWMKDFFEQLIAREDCAIDVFNLNYDTWIEQILNDYVDGYVPLEGYDQFTRFSNNAYLNPGYHHTVSHLHGQICFEEPDFRIEDINRFAYEEQEYTLYKYADYKNACDYRKRHVRSDDKSQAGHNIFLTNLITGKMKPDKILWAPMQVYMYGFIKALAQNEDLLIIGYGFGDQYINNLLFQYLQFHPNRKHIRMVTKTDPEKFERKVSMYGSPFQDTRSRFAQCMMHKVDWCSPFDFPDNGCYRSVYDDNVAEIYLNGFKDFCERYVENRLANTARKD